MGGHRHRMLGYSLQHVGPLQHEERDGSWYNADVLLLPRFCDGSFIGGHLLLQNPPTSERGRQIQLG